MIPADQMSRLQNELDAMSVEGLQALQVLPDNLLWRTLNESLKINRYNLRRRRTQDIPITKIREIIQECLLDKIYDTLCGFRQG